jgi:hypothetical protein
MKRCNPYLEPNASPDPDIENPVLKASQHPDIELKVVIGVRITSR